MISIEDLVRYRRRNEVLVERVAETRLPTSHGDFTAYGYRISVDDSEHVALVYGDITGPTPRCSPGCTPSASPATCSAATAATAARSSTRRWTRS